jgi:diacylglycerol kinase (ATP)
MAEIKQRIRFIINPNSGVKRKQTIPSLIKKHLDHSKFDYEIAFTKAAGHATELAQEAVDSNQFDIIAAVGGDGSINETAEGVIGTDKTLAILPHGSGNGFATYLGISRNIEKAINVINTGKVSRVDTCTLNDQPFLNLAGFGFDGLVAYHLDKAPRRGFLAYFLIGIQQAFLAKSHQFTIKIDDEAPFVQDAFLVEVGNGAMFGYGFTILPSSNVSDGIMDLLLVKKTNKLRYLPLIPKLLLNNFDRGSKFVETHRGTTIQVDFDAPIHMHYDGEGFLQKKNSVTFKIAPQSLNIILPQERKEKYGKEK